MLTLEQIGLLETKITRAIKFITQITEENARLKERNAELEKITAALREEKSKVEEGIVSAMGKLNQFEDAIERSLSAIKSPKPAKEDTSGQQTAPVQARPSAPSSAYSVDEDEEDDAVEDNNGGKEIEELGEAELDIY